MVAPSLACVGMATSVVPFKVRWLQPWWGSVKSFVHVNVSQVWGVCVGIWVTCPQWAPSLLHSPTNLPSPSVPISPLLLRRRGWVGSRNWQKFSSLASRRWVSKWQWQRGRQAGPRGTDEWQRSWWWVDRSMCLMRPNYQPLIPVWWHETPNSEGTTSGSFVLFTPYPTVPKLGSLCLPVPSSFWQTSSLGIVWFC